MEYKLCIGEDENGHRVTLELEIEHRGPQFNTLKQPIVAQTVDQQPITEYDRLSISGTSRYGCGQIIDTIRKNLPNYKKLYLPLDKVERILNIWDTWHLNDMSAACAHQKKNWNLAEKVTLTKYQISYEGERRLTKRVTADVKAMGGTIDVKDLSALNAASRYSDAAKALLTLKLLGIESFSWKAIDPKHYAEVTRTVRSWNKSRLPSVDSSYGDWTVSSAITTQTEEKHLTWVPFKENERGLLNKPCEVCGYKYGNAWLVTPLPEDVKAEAIALFTGADEQPTEPEADTIEGFIAANPLGYECRPVNARNDGVKMQDKDARHFRVTITRGEYSMGLYFSQGSAHTADPTLADVLRCLASDASDFDRAGDVGEWADELGYDNLKEAVRTYKMIERQVEQLKRVLGDNYATLLEVDRG